MLSILFAAIAVSQNPCDLLGERADSLWFSGSMPAALVHTEPVDTVRVEARGWAPDSLCINVAIRSLGREVFQTSWNSAAYFFYGSPPRDQMWERVRRNLARLVSSDALRLLVEDPRYLESIGADGWEALSWDLFGEQLSDSLEATGLTAAAVYRRVQELLRAPDRRRRVDALWAELAEENPTTYEIFSGGEWHRRIAWSRSLQRFVTVFSCC